MRFQAVKNSIFLSHHQILYFIFLCCLAALTCSIILQSYIPAQYCSATLLRHSSTLQHVFGVCNQLSCKLKEDFHQATKLNSAQYLTARRPLKRLKIICILWLARSQLHTGDVHNAESSVVAALPIKHCFAFVPLNSSN